LNSKKDKKRVAHIGYVKEEETDKKINKNNLTQIYVALFEDQKCGSYKGRNMLKKF